MIIRRGSILVYRVFDVAEEVNLLSAERILRQMKGESRLRLARPGKNAVVMRNAPVRAALGETEVTIPLNKSGESATFKADLVATIWDYGAISVQFQIPIPAGTSLEKLSALSEGLTGELSELSDLDAIARTKAREVATLLAPAIKTPGEWDFFEDYVIYFFEEIEGVDGGLDLLEKGNVTGLILGEPREQMAEITRQSVIENTFMYARNDMVVIDWNSAVVLEPSGQRDIPDVIEFALTHLLEVRFYDDLLDKRIAELYDTIEARRSSLLRSYFGEITRYANRRFIEFSEFMERIDNSLKVVGDFYLAVIFRGAVRKFRIPDWQQSIQRKMNLLAQVSDLMESEVNVRRGHLMEMVVILLILFEVVTAFLRH